MKKNNIFMSIQEREYWFRVILKRLHNEPALRAMVALFLTTAPQDEKMLEFMTGLKKPKSNHTYDSTGTV